MFNEYNDSLVEDLHRDLDQLELGDIAIYDNDVWYIRHIFSDGYISIEKNGGMDSPNGQVKEVFYTDI